MKNYFKRFFKYIVYGIPNVIVQSNVYVSSPTDLLKNRVIMITGGNRGLGFAIAKKCIDEGATVVIVARNLDKLLQAKEQLGGKCKILQCDLNNIENVKLLIDIIEKYNVDSLINNAGVSFHEKSSFEVTIDGFDRQFNINFKLPYFLSVECANYFLNHKINGNIINIVSERGLFCDDRPYGLTKGALISFTQGLSRRLVKNNIRINAIAPGITSTDMTGYKATDNLHTNYSCGGRVYLPEEIAEVTSFLLSEQSKCINGEVIACDSGNYIRCDW